MWVFCAFLSLLGILSVWAADYPAPNPTFDAGLFTTWTGEAVRASRRAKVFVPFTASDGTSDMVSMLRLDLVGNDYERGYAHGYLMARGTHSIGNV